MEHIEIVTRWHGYRDFFRGDPEVVLHDRPTPKSFYKVNTVKFLRDLVKQKWNK